MEEDTNCRIDKELPEYVLETSEVAKVRVDLIKKSFTGWEDKESIVHPFHPRIIWIMPKRDLKWSTLYNLALTKFGTARLMENLRVVTNEEKFLQEKNTFMSIKSRLLRSRRYTGKFVAIHDGRIVGYD